MGKKIGYSILFIILLLILFRIDVPLDTYRRSYEYPGITYITAHYISFLGSGGVLAGIALLIFVAGLISDSEKTIQTAHQLIISLLITGIIIGILKLTLGRIRPKLSNKGTFILFPGTQGGVQSFPSGHTAAIFSFAPILATISPVTGFIAYALATIVGITRIHSDLHFISDVVIGALLGIGVGEFVVSKSKSPTLSRFFQIPISSKTILIYALITILWLSGYLFFFKLGQPGVFDLDEAVFSEATREMLETGNWITPYMNYQPRFDKPILIYWLMAIAYQLFGINEFAARFWSAVNGTLLALFIFYFGKKWKDIKFGLLSALIFLTCLETIILGHAVLTDMTLLLFLSTALLSFYLGYLSETEKGKRWYWLFYISMAFAVLTKGLIGIVFPGTIIFLFLIATRQFRPVVKEAKLLPGILVFLIIALPWYILVYLQNGWVFIQNFLLFHHIHRFTSHIAGHSGNMFYYIIVILFGFFPWSGFLISATKSAIPWHWKSWKDIPRKDQFLLYCILWALLIFIFFTFAQTKLPNYVAPLFPPIAFLVAAWWYNRLNLPAEALAQAGPKSDLTTLKASLGKNQKFSNIFLFILGFILASAFLVSPIIIKKVAASGHLSGAESFQLGIVPYLLALPIIIGVVSASLLLWRKRYAASFVLLICMMIIFWYIAVNGLIPIVYEYQQGPLYRYATAWRNEVQPNDIIIEFGFNCPSVIFYSHHPILRLGTNEFDRLKELIQSPTRVYIITNKPKFREQLEQIPNFKLIQIYGQYLFGRNFADVNQ